MKNKFGGRCLHCGEWVEPLAGRFRLVSGVLKLFHKGCGAKIPGGSLTSTT